MILYINRQNIESYVQSYDANTELYNRCNTMLKRHFDIHVDCSDEELVSSEECMAWLNSLLDGRGDSLSFSNGSPDDMPITRPVDASTFPDATTIDAHSAVYLLDENVDALSDKGNYLVGGLGEELQVLSRLLIGDVDDQYTRSLPLRRHFVTGNWDALNQSVLPCSDIVISDAYILSNSVLYAKNLYAYIQKLTKDLYTSRVNIVIFCLKETNYCGSMHSPNWSSVRSDLKHLLSADYIDANITFVAPDSEKVFQEHDRTVFTNYVYYAPGACLNFFSRSGTLTSNGRHFDIKSIAKVGYLEEAKDFLADMQKLITDIESGTKSGYIDKDTSPNLCNFLTIS